MTSLFADQKQKKNREMAGETLIVLAVITCAVAGALAPTAMDRIAPDTKEATAKTVVTKPAVSRLPSVGLPHHMSMKACDGSQTVFTCVVHLDDSGFVYDGWKFTMTMWRSDGVIVPGGVVLAPNMYGDGDYEIKFIVPAGVTDVNLHNSML